MIDRRDEDKHWHLDKRVPIALILAILVQSFGAVWWAASFERRVIVLEETSKAGTDIRDRLARIEEAQRWVGSSIVELKDSLKLVAAALRETKR